MVDQLHGAAEELKAHQGRLATLPRDPHGRNAGVGLDQLADVTLQQLIGHPEAAPGIQHLPLRERKQYEQSRLHTAPVGFASR